MKLKNSSSINIPPPFLVHGHHGPMMAFTELHAALNQAAELGTCSATFFDLLEFL